jgi:hypothetical protein
MRRAIANCKYQVQEKELQQAANASLQTLRPGAVITFSVTHGDLNTTLSTSRQTWA